MSEPIKTICVTNRLLCDNDFLEQIEKLCKIGIKRFILREKDLPPNEYFKLAKQVQKIVQNYDCELFGNFFEEQTKLACLKGFQYSFKSFCEKTSRHFPTEGVSVHSLKEATAAEKLGADYLIAGHIFPTDCKKGLPPRGLGFLSEICQSVSIPVYAIGGINEKNAPECIKAGAAGVCIMSGLMKK